MLTIQNRQNLPLTLSLSSEYCPLDTFYIVIEVNYEEVNIPLEYIGQDGKLANFIMRELPPKAINCGIRDFHLVRVNGDTLDKFLVYEGVIDIKNIEENENDKYL